MKKVIELSTLSPWQQRIELAKDVIASLEAERIISQSGCWVRVENPGVYSGFDSELAGNDEIQLQEIIKDKKCQVCALGALFIESVRKFDNFTLGDLSGGYSIDNDDITVYLDGLFDYDQLLLIEVAYERGSGGYDVRWDFRDEDRAVANNAVAFGRTISDDRERLVAIMKNIIANDGEFIPPVVTDG